VLLAAVAVRVAVLPLQGHASDLDIVARWAEALARDGPRQFYGNHQSVYPALLYLYWPMGILFDGDGLRLAIKASSIPFDLAVAGLLLAATRRMGRGEFGVAAAAVYLFNPGVLLAGPIWGQIDAAGAALMLGTALATALGWFLPAGALAALAAMVKPQFGLVGLVVVAAAFMTMRDRRSARPPIEVAVGGVTILALVAYPLGLSPGEYAEQLRFFAEHQPYTSLYAPNLWGAVFGYAEADGALRYVGLALLVCGLALSLLPLRGRRQVVPVLVATTFVIFAFHFLPTRVHERYLLPALALVAPFAVQGWREFAAYVGLSLAFAASLAYQLATTSPGTVPIGIADVLLTPGSVWVQAAVLGGAAAILASLLLVRARREEAPSGPRG
jgi:Gpi18-like mannosyltransferase